MGGAARATNETANTWCDPTHINNDTVTPLTGYPRVPPNTSTLADPTPDNDHRNHAREAYTSHMKCCWLGHKRVTSEKPTFVVKRMFLVAFRVEPKVAATCMRCQPVRDVAIVFFFFDDTCMEQCWCDNGRHQRPRELFFW